MARKWVEQTCAQVGGEGCFVQALDAHPRQPPHSYSWGSGQHHGQPAVGWSEGPQVVCSSLAVCQPSSGPDGERTLAFCSPGTSGRKRGCGAMLPRRPAEGPGEWAVMHEGSALSSGVAWSRQKGQGALLIAPLSLPLRLSPAPPPFCARDHRRVQEPPRLWVELFSSPACSNSLHFGLLLKPTWHDCNSRPWICFQSPSPSPSL